VDGVPLAGEALRRWQKNIAHVPQAIFLSDGSLAENIAFGLPAKEIDMDKVQKAAHLAQISDFIEGLQAQYETYVGERGIRLSGGQRQRIGIARALYTEASIIVFDEATSALDNATEKEVMDSINGLSSQFTIILIAHRLSTVEKCDQVFELSHGQLISDGNYQNFLKKTSIAG
jgi:ATP-binding cassette subfamily B protein